MTCTIHLYWTTSYYIQTKYFPNSWDNFHPHLLGWQMNDTMPRVGVNCCSWLTQTTTLSETSPSGLPMIYFLSLWRAWTSYFKISLSGGGTSIYWEIKSISWLLVPWFLQLSSPSSWIYKIDTLSAALAPYEYTRSLVVSLYKWPIMRSFDVFFFDVSFSKLLNK